MAKGIVDAATFPYEGAASFDLGTVAKYALEPGVSSATFAVVMNQAKYDSLPSDLKELIAKTTGPARAECVRRDVGRGREGRQGQSPRRAVYSRSS